MIKSMRRSSLDSLGVPPVIEFFRQGKLPLDASLLVDQIFGPPDKRGAMVISGGLGIVGAGKSVQFASRLYKFGVPVIALDLPFAQDNLSKQISRLYDAFPKEKAGRIAEMIVKMTYDGQTIPPKLHDFRPKVLIEAIPEILEMKKAHYALFKNTFPEILIRSVTSGFPQAKLGVGIAHPAFPHETNKVFEVVESEPSQFTKLLWALGLIPIPVKDRWSFVLDVLFCGITLAALCFHRKTNMPFWKIDKYVRNLVGPNPFRAHDAIGAKGANFLTWSCLHHLALEYGDLFKPTKELIFRKDAGIDWYPLNHFRPIVNFPLYEDERSDFEAMILGHLLQMTALLIYEKRADFPSINIIGENCAQFRKGVLALARSLGKEKIESLVTHFHSIHPEAKNSCWHKEVFDDMETPDWQQLYVNAEHDGEIGVITIGRERYNNDVDAELNRAIDYLHREGIKKVILTHDYHFATQLIGADTSEFYPCLHDIEKGKQRSLTWSKTARRLYNEFDVSVGFIGGKRCLGGSLELMSHCHYLVAVEDAEVGFPEVTLPVVPGMEATHWLFRKVNKEDWGKIADLLLTGKRLHAKETSGWLCDIVEPPEQALRSAYMLVTGKLNIRKREVCEKPLEEVSEYIRISSPQEKAAVDAIAKAILEATRVSLTDALYVQSSESASFMTNPLCLNGTIGKEYKKFIVV